MGFLTKSARGEDLGDSETAQLEEQYEKMYAKIGRDFISREDFINIVARLLAIIDPLGQRPIDLNDNSEARKKAAMYKEILDSGKDGSKLFKDLVSFDDED